MVTLDSVKLFVCITITASWISYLSYCDTIDIQSQVVHSAQYWAYKTDSTDKRMALVRTLSVFTYFNLTYPSAFTLATFLSWWRWQKKEDSSLRSFSGGKYKTWILAVDPISYTYLFLRRSEECGPLYAFFVIHHSGIVTLHPKDIKVWSLLCMW